MAKNSTFTFKSKSLTQAVAFLKKASKSYLLTSGNFMRTNIEIIKEQGSDYQYARKS